MSQLAMSQPAMSCAFAALSAFALISSAAAQPAPADNKPDVTLGSTPDTVIWGYLSARVPPVLRIKSGTTVRIDTMSHQGLVTLDDPVTYFGKAGIKPEEVLQDAKDIYAKVPRGKGLGVHVLTGPIWIENAVPGDALEVRVLDLQFRVPYGVNNTGPGSGVLPDLVPTPSPNTSRAASSAARSPERPSAHAAKDRRWPIHSLLPSGMAGDRRSRTRTSSASPGTAPST